VHDARYFRSRAELCLTMARQMSDPAAADYLRTMAAHYVERAAAVETEAGSSRSASASED
jgi:hypothetical protein